MPVLFRVFRSTGLEATNLFSGPKRNKALVRMIGTFFLSFRTFDFLMPFNVRFTAWPSERLRFMSGEERRFILFILLTSRQGQGHHNSVGQLLWALITYPTLSSFPVGGNRNTRRKPTTFGRVLTLLFSHEDWVRVHLTGDRTRNHRGERRVV